MHVNAAMVSSWSQNFGRCLFVVKREMDNAYRVLLYNVSLWGLPDLVLIGPGHFQGHGFGGSWGKLRAPREHILCHQSFWWSWLKLRTWPKFLLFQRVRRGPEISPPLSHFKKGFSVGWPRLLYPEWWGSHGSSQDTPESYQHYAVSSQVVFASESKARTVIPILGRGRRVCSCCFCWVEWCDRDQCGELSSSQVWSL